MQFDLVSVFGTAGLGAVGLYVVGALPPARRVGELAIPGFSFLKSSVAPRKSSWKNHGHKGHGVKTAAVSFWTRAKGRQNGVRTAPALAGRAYRDPAEPDREGLPGNPGRASGRVKPCYRSTRVFPSARASSA